MVVHDFLMAVPVDVRHDLVHHRSQGQLQIVGFALAQHLGQISLGVYIQHQDFFTFQRKTGPQVVDGRAFANSALLICYAYQKLYS